MSGLRSQFMCIEWVVFVVDVYSLDCVDGSCVLSGWCEWVIVHCMCGLCVLRVLYA